MASACENLTIGIIKKSQSRSGNINCNFRPALRKRERKSTGVHCNSSGYQSAIKQYHGKTSNKNSCIVLDHPMSTVEVRGLELHSAGLMENWISKQRTEESHLIPTE